MITHTPGSREQAHDAIEESYGPHGLIGSLARHYGWTAERLEEHRREAHRVADLEPGTPEWIEQQATVLHLVEVARTRRALAGHPAPARPTSEGS